MTTVQITLPDQLAREAQRAGLLSPEFLETMASQDACKTLCWLDLRSPAALWRHFRTGRKSRRSSV